LIGNDENYIQGHFYDATVSKMAANKIDKLLMVSDNNPRYRFSLKLENTEILPILLAAILIIKITLNAIFIITNQFLKELIGNDEICIQGHFYEATNFKMAANKIVKLSMVSDFNEN
jgi:hypothetical protein